MDSQINKKLQKVLRFKNINTIMAERNEAASPRLLADPSQKGSFVVRGGSELKSNVMDYQPSTVTLSPVPRYMQQTMYNQPGRNLQPRFKSPCAKLTKRNLQNTFHDQADPLAGKTVSLNSYMGIDYRGDNKLQGLKRRVTIKNTNKKGEPCGVGLLSKKSGRI